MYRFLVLLFAGLLLLPALTPAAPAAPPIPALVDSDQMRAIPASEQAMAHDLIFLIYMEDPHRHRNLPVRT